MSANKKPMEIRKLHGTDQTNKHRNNENIPEPSSGIGPGAKYLSNGEREIWDEIVSISCPGVLGNTDRISLEIMCRLLYRFRFGDHDKDAVLVNLNGAELSQLSSLLGRFGMTPVDRMKLSVPKSKPKNSFGDL
jgi:hypothetical protein